MNKYLSYILLSALILSHINPASAEVAVTSTPHAPRSASSHYPFTKLSAVKLGIDYHNKLDPQQFIEPFYMGRGIASGDVDNDGWIDIALATDKGFLVYKNKEGKAFEKQSILIDTFKEKQVFAIALADMNNDNWLDVYITTFAEGNYLILGPLTGNDSLQTYHIDTDQALVSLGLSMADVNQDGFLDIAEGNWSGGNIFRTPGAIAQNYIILNHDLTFERKPLSEVHGQTFSTLFSDFTNDGNIDLIMENDFDPPDMFYKGDGDGNFQVITQQDNVIPASPNLAMGAATGDFNNDLIPDLYLVGVAYDMDTLGIDLMSAKSYQGAIEKGDVQDAYCDSLNEEEKEACYTVAYLSRYALLHEINSCNFTSDLEVKLSEEIEKSCLVFKLLNQAVLRKDRTLCDKLPEKYTDHIKTCHRILDSNTVKEWGASTHIIQKKNANVLLQGSRDGHFSDVSKEMGTRFGAWGWNSRFIDLDNDGWQDIFLVNGSPYDAAFRMFGRDSNVFFHNLDGKSFVKEQAFFGLENYAHTTAYTAFDYDNDGDLDILTNTDYGTYSFYKNNDNEGNSITFSIEDYKGNQNGIGTKIIIRYGKDGEHHQMREITAGGGYLSFDAPRVHFGLGKYEKVKSVEIRWSTGEVNRIDQKNQIMGTGRHYKIIRK